MAVKHLYDSIYPSLLITIVFGLSSLYLTEKNLKLKKFTILKVITILYIAAFTVLIYLAFTNSYGNNLLDNYATGVAHIGLIFQLLGQIIFFYIAFLINSLRTNRFLLCLENIQNIDRILEDLGEKIEYTPHFQYEFTIYSTGIFILLCRIIVNYIYVKRHVIVVNDDLYLIFVFPCFVVFILQTHFTMLVRLLYERFYLINRQIKHLTKSKKNTIKMINVLPSSEFDIKQREFLQLHIIKRLEMLMDLHDSLNDIGNKVNSSFTIQLLISFLIQFINAIFTIFYVYYESLVMKNMISAINWLFWTIFTIFELLHITVTCHATARECKGAGGEIHKVLMQEPDIKLRRKLIVFSQQVSHRTLEFTACGLFTIDATLLFTIVGASATYLLIMLQFQEGLETQCAQNKTIT